MIGYWKDRRSISSTGSRPKVCQRLWNEHTGRNISISVASSEHGVGVTQFIEAPSSAILNRDVVGRASDVEKADQRVLDAINGGSVLSFRERVIQIDEMTFSVLRFVMKILRKAIWNQRVSAALVSRLALRVCDRSRSCHHLFIAFLRRSIRALYRRCGSGFDGVVTLQFPHPMSNVECG